ncbi:MAG: hypothetical protein AAGA48_27885 [Myxococcota bacterium]
MQAKRIVGAVGIAMAVVFTGCEVDQGEAEQIEQTWLDEDAEAARLSGGGFGGGSGARCTTFDGVTSGCEDDEVCLPIACTNSIPPFCFGFCQPGFP